MDKRKEIQEQRRAEKEQKQLEEKPFYQYINSDTLEFPKLIRESYLYSADKIDNKLEKLNLEISIIEEQRHLQTRIERELKDNKITISTPDGGRLADIGEVKTMSRIAEATIWQSKQNVEKILTDLMGFIKIPVPTKVGVYLLTDDEHNELGMNVAKRLAKSDVQIFTSNKEKLFKQIKG